MSWSWKINLDDHSLNRKCYLIVMKDRKSLKWEWFWFNCYDVSKVEFLKKAHTWIKWARSRWWIVFFY